LIEGAGPRGFCVGADIHEFRDRESATECRNRLSQHPWMEAFAAGTKPVIAAIHGYCFGGGMEIALACDLRVAAPGSIFALPEVDLGLIPGAGATQRLPRMIGMDRALELVLTGERVDALKAFELGMITRLAASDESLQEEALLLAARIAAKPPTAVAYGKEAVRRGLELPLSAGLQLERDLFCLLTDTDERRAAVAAFKARRK
jgi:enoyl-CoA hydratase/carnithine racemase